MPSPDDWMACDLKNDICDFVETNKKIFLQYEAESSNSNMQVEENSEPEVVLQQPSRSVFDVLMNKKESFPKLKENASLGPAKQYNAIVNFIIRRKYGVKASSLTDYEMCVKQLAELFWEIDPNYSKFKVRGKSFPVIAEQFFGFNKPTSHGHVPKQICSMSLSLKVQKLYNFIDRSFMDSSHMKSFKDTLLAVAEKVSQFVQEMEESNLRTKKCHQETKSKEFVIEDFVVTNINTKSVHINTIWHDHFAKVQESLRNADVYKPIVINELIHVNNRSNFMKVIKHLLEEGLPFNFNDVSVYHFKLPSSGPHPAVHFLWKQPVGDANSCPAQLKLIHDLKSQSKSYYTRAMKLEIRKTILKIGIAKRYQANFMIKELLGDDSAANDKCEKAILDRLNIAVEAGEEVIIDLRNNNGRKPKFEDFWQVNTFRSGVALNVFHSKIILPFAIEYSKDCFIL